jgi:hypothetical protein
MLNGKATKWIMGVVVTALFALASFFAGRLDGLYDRVSLHEQAPHHVGSEIRMEALDQRLDRLDLRLTRIELNQEKMLEELRKK